MEAFRSRPLHHSEFPYLFLDATYLHVRRDPDSDLDGGGRGDCVHRHRGREILGLDVGDSEDGVFWRVLLRILRERGPAGVRLVISDQHAGPVAATAGSSRVAHQRCRAHFACNLLALVPKSQGHGRLPV